MEVSGQHQVLAIFFVKEPQYPLNSMLGDSQSHFGHFEEQKNLLLLLGFKTCISQPVAQSLYQLIKR